MRAHVTSSGDNPDFRLIRSGFRGEGGPGERIVNEKSATVLRLARLKVGVKSGTLLASLRRGDMEQGPTGPYRDVTAGVRGLTPYLGFHMDGAPPHVIRPRRRKALRFIQNGQVRFATKVNHPGNAGNDFLRDALRDAMR